MLEEIRRLDAQIGPVALPLVEHLILHGHPRGFVLQPDAELGDGRPLLRYAAVGAFRFGDSDRKVIGDLRVTVAKATARCPRQELHAFAVQLWEVDQLDDQAMYDIAQHFERMYLELARRELYELDVEGAEIGKAIWIGAPSREQGTPPDDWMERVRAIGFSYGIDIQVHGRLGRDSLPGILHEIRDLTWDLLIVWAPNITSDVQQCVEIYCATTDRERVIHLHEVRFDKLQEAIRLQLMDAGARLTARPNAGGVVVPETGTAYLQKRGTGGDHDIFDIRANPCGHPAFRRMEHADKGFKGIERLFGRTPKAVYKCAWSKCQCWRATFE
jgi:hypothetical protein